MVIRKLSRAAKCSEISNLWLQQPRKIVSIQVSLENVKVVTDDMQEKLFSILLKNPMIFHKGAYGGSASLCGQWAIN